ncbi:hypothetical protein J3U64_08780, partial [Snodgrassella sp. B3800]|uniref:hypothetical protein n=1 Tax=Snodgrassella sp. B3800 TaxID=2818039 RepID=UPI00226AFC67
MSGYGKSEGYAGSDLIWPVRTPAAGRWFPDQKRTGVLLLNTKFVTVKEDNSVPLVKKANLLSHENLTCLLYCCESEQLNFTDILQALGKLLAERDGLSSMAMVDAVELVFFCMKSEYANRWFELLSGVNRTGNEED